jgi:hypothetical protein
MRLKYDRRWLRKPKTMAEKRAYELAAIQGVKPRGKRSLRGIVDAWDDIPLSRVHSKCWKERRQFQHGPGVRLMAPTQVAEW